MSHRCFAVMLVLITGGCEGQLSITELDDQELTSDADPEPAAGERSPFVASLPLEAAVEVCRVSAGLSLRTGPSATYLVLGVLPAGTRARIVGRQESWYKLELEEQQGWAFGGYLCPATDSAEPAGREPSSAPGVSRDRVINNAKAFLRFSYWWGGARLKVGSRDYGRCYGSKGHSGPYGADCSGYVGKVWQLPEAMPFEQNKHPFSTHAFYYGKSRWTAIGRGEARRADAMVYNTGGSKPVGHIMIYESGDRWGQAWTYEARGCAHGIVHNVRTITSKYRARKRHGL